MSSAETEITAPVSRPGLLHSFLKGRWHLIEVLFLVVALGMLALGPRTPSKRIFSLLFSSIILEALPFMLLGAVVGGLVEIFVSHERLTSVLPRRRWLAVLVAAGMGIVFPVCECAVVPVVRRLVRKGLPMSAAVAYLLGAPVANPIVAASTAMAYRFDWRVVVSRVGIGYGIAVVIGLLLDRLFRGREVFHADLLSSDPHHHGDEAVSDHPTSHPGTLWQRLNAALRHAADDFVDVGHFFVIGAFIAALAQTYIDRNLLVSVTHQPLAAILLMMLLAVALNLCSEADAFVASSFRGLVPMSAQLAFLLLGPILDLKLLLMYQTLFRRRVIAALATAMALLVLIAAMGLHASGRFSL